MHTGRVTSCTPSKDFTKIGSTNTEMRDPLYFLTITSTPFKRIWKRLCSYSFDTNIQIQLHWKKGFWDSNSYLPESLDHEFPQIIRTDSKIQKSWNLLIWKQVYPDNDHCSRYFKCANGSLTHETCENGLLFDQVKIISILIVD